MSDEESESPLTSLPRRVQHRREPAPTSRRQIGERQRKMYLERLIELGDSRAAANAIGHKDTRTVNFWKREDPDFLQACVEAVEAYCDKLEGLVLRRAEEGTIEAVRHQGKVVGFDREYNVQRELAALRALRPDRWGDNKRVDITHTKKTGVLVVAAKERTLDEVEMEAVRVHQERIAMIERRRNATDAEFAPVEDRSTSVEDLL